MNTFITVLLKEVMSVKQDDVRKYDKIFNLHKKALIS